jgi:hypothetical protein
MRTSRLRLFPLSAVALSAAIALLAACGARVDGGSGASCAPPSPGLCAPSVDCPADGHRYTGQSSCVDGAWVCAKEACGDAGDAPSDAQGDAGCDGALVPECTDGHISAFCCPKGAPCGPPPISCNLGGGLCVLGECPVDGGCSKGSIAASSYDQSCGTDADCTAVFEGSGCSMCLCPNGAIAKTALATYQAALAKLSPGPNVCACPLIPAPHCNGGRCSLP